MLDEIVSHLVQPMIGGDHFVVLPQQLFQQRLLVRVQFGLGNRFGDSVVQVEPGEAQFLAPVLIDQPHRGPVLFGTLEVVARDVAAEDAPG